MVEYNIEEMLKKIDYDWLVYLRKLVNLEYNKRAWRNEKSSDKKKACC